MKLRSVQVLRGIAAVAVVLIHATAKAFNGGPGTFYWGSAGVDLFFVTSGFIIGTIAPGQQPGHFFKRRLWRIYPMWWIATIPFLLIQGTVWQKFATNLTLWPIWGVFILPVPSVGWTLCFEMLFYLGATLALATSWRVPFAVFGAMLLASPFTDNPTIDFLGNPIILEFAMGLAISRMKRWPEFAWPLIVSGLLILALSPSDFFDRATAIDASTAPWRVLWWGVPCAMVFMGALSLEDAFKARAWNIPVLIGDASYSIYLFHLPVTKSGVGPWYVTATLAVAFGVAIYWLLERRILSLRLTRPLREPGAFLR